MPLTIPEALALGQQLGRLAGEAHRVLVHDETRNAAEALWSAVQAAVNREGPGGRRVTKEERQAILTGLFELLASLRDINTDEAAALHADVVAFALQLVRDVLD